MLHVVNKLQFEAACATESQAFDLRLNFSGARQDEIAAVIDKVCSKYVAEDEWVKIDRIEVDMGHFDIHAFEQLFTNLFLAKFEKAFTEKLQPITAWDKETAKQQSMAACIIVFLKSGVLPWWAPVGQADLQRIMLEVLEKQEAKLKEFLLEHRFDRNIWMRISYQFDESIQLKLISIFPELISAAKKIRQWILGTEQGIQFVTEPSRVQKTIFLIHKYVLEDAGLFFTVMPTEQVLIGRVKESLVPFLHAAGLDLPFNFPDEKIMDPESSLFTEEDPRKMHAVDPLKENEKPAFEDDGQYEMPERIMVRQAGIVLLAPYLKSFFTNLELLDGNEWKDHRANYKAIHLLHFLATGLQNAPEHSLVLEKLLCGMQPANPIPADIELTVHEMEEGEELLRSVVENWQVLKNTSINGLRETFLKRDGVLSRKEKDWLLQVERKTADVLLESIPWGYSTISLGWNEHLVIIEW